METFYAEREKKIKEEHIKKLKKEEYVNECIKKLEVEQEQKKEDFLKKEKKRSLILRSIDMDRTKKSMNTTKKNMDKFLQTEQNRQKLEESQKNNTLKIFHINNYIS